jgi:iron complex outermembrane receptor protein
LTYALNDTQSIFANFKKGYSAPQTTELYRLQRHQTVGEIDSQEIKSAELGVRHASKNISFEILAFWMRKDNFFMRDSDGYNVVNGKTDHKGVELSTSAFLTDNIDLTAQYSYAIHKYRFNNNASDISSGDDIDSAPRNLANAILGWDINTNNRVELEWNHVGEYYLDTSNEHEYDGHDLFNLRISSNIQDSLALNFQIENIANTAYADRADYAYGDYRFFPGRPRFAELSLSYDF